MTACMGEMMEVRPSRQQAWQPRLRMRERREEHLDADEELLQAGRHVIHIVRRPVLRRMWGSLVMCGAHAPVKHLDVLGF